MSYVAVTELAKRILVNILSSETLRIARLGALPAQNVMCYSIEGTPVDKFGTALLNQIPWAGNFSLLAGSLIASVILALLSVVAIIFKDELTAIAKQHRIMILAYLSAFVLGSIFLSSLTLIILTVGLILVVVFSDWLSSHAIQLSAQRSARCTTIAGFSAVVVALSVGIIQVSIPAPPCNQIAAVLLGPIEYNPVRPINPIPRTAGLYAQVSKRISDIIDDAKYVEIVPVVSEGEYDEFFHQFSGIPWSNLADRIVKYPKTEAKCNIREAFIVQMEENDDGIGVIPYVRFGVYDQATKKFKAAPMSYRFKIINAKSDKIGPLFYLISYEIAMEMIKRFYQQEGREIEPTLTRQLADQFTEILSSAYRDLGEQPQFAKYREYFSGTSKCTTLDCTDKLHDTLRDYLAAELKKSLDDNLGDNPAVTAAAVEKGKSLARE